MYDGPIANIYIAKIPLLEQIFSLFQSLWFHSLMNVLLNSYHVTAITSFNNSLLDA